MLLSRGASDEESCAAGWFFVQAGTVWRARCLCGPLRGVVKGLFCEGRKASAIQMMNGAMESFAGAVRGQSLGGRCGRAASSISRPAAGLDAAWRSMCSAVRDQWLR